MNMKGEQPDSEVLTKIQLAAPVLQPVLLRRCCCPALTPRCRLPRFSRTPAKPPEPLDGARHHYQLLGTMAPAKQRRGVG